MAQTRHPDRRDFLKSGVLAAAGTSLLGAGLAVAAAAPSTKTIDVGPAGIPLRAFGKTGHKLPVLGMGGSAFVKRFNAAYGVPLLSMDERVAMVRRGYDGGIRYFDTARVYGESEKIVGRALADVRGNCYVATKCHLSDPKKTRETLEKSLSELDMDYVDCVQIHSPCIEAVGFDGAMKVHAELVKLRDEKMLRFIGLTTHVAFETVLQMIETGNFDQVLLANGYFRKGMVTLLSNRKLEYRDLCLAKAHELGMGIVAMKVLGANIMSHNAKNIVPDYDPGKFGDLAAAAIRWAASDERVSMLNIGVSMASDIDKNLKTITGNLRLTHADRRLLTDFSTLAYESEAVKKMKTS